MKIQYYKSALCPRCVVVTRTLAELEAAHTDLEIERIEILAHPARTFKAGVRQIPALVIDGQKKSWFKPKKQEILDFVSSHEA